MRPALGYDQESSFFRAIFDQSIGGCRKKCYASVENYILFRGLPSRLSDFSLSDQIRSDQSLSHVRLIATP